VEWSAAVTAVPETGGERKDVDAASDDLGAFAIDTDCAHAHSSLREDAQGVATDSVVDDFETGGIASRRSQPERTWRWHADELRHPRDYGTTRSRMWSGSGYHRSTLSRLREDRAGQVAKLR